MAGVSELIVPDVHVENERNIHDNLALNANITGISSVDLGLWTLRSLFTISRLEKKPKVGSEPLFKEFQDLFVKAVLGTQDHLPKDYQYWGDNNSTDNLPVFLRSNPFFASALSSSVNAAGAREFEIKSSPSSNDTNWFRRIVGTLDNSYVLVDAKFDVNMNLTRIRTYKAANEAGTIFEWQAGNKKTSVNEDENIRAACAQLMFLLGFHSQVIHALIHVLHYMFDCAIVGKLRVQ